LPTTILLKIWLSLLKSAFEPATITAIIINADQILLNAIYGFCLNVRCSATYGRQFLKVRKRPEFSYDSKFNYAIRCRVCFQNSSFPFCQGIQRGIVFSVIVVDKLRPTLFFTTRLRSQPIVINNYICRLIKIMSSLIQQLNETLDFIRHHYSASPLVGIVLGSGLGNFTSEMKVEKEIPYSDIPHFPVSTVEGHSGKLIFGEMGGRQVVAMAGRFHFYEGYTPQQVIYPIRVMKMLGVETVLISNAAGGTNKNFSVGDLMIIKDHISFFVINPLLGKNEDELGARFPDMSEPMILL
jgi:hypothetical protein